MEKKKTTARSHSTGRSTAVGKKAAPPKATKKKAKADRIDAAVKSVAKAAGAKAAPKKPAPKKTSALDAAAKVLAGSKSAMTTKQLVDAMAAEKLWSSPGGKTPDRTLYSAILREINVKGKDSRFKKTERGKFALAK